MSRSMILALSLLLALQWTGALASSSDHPDSRKARDWRGKLCINCQPEGEAEASRVVAQVPIASKLAAPNTCADPGPSAWFAEEEDHLTAFLNSAPTQYK